VNDLAIHDVVKHFQVRNLERADGLDGLHDGLVGAAQLARVV